MKRGRTGITSVIAGRHTEFAPPEMTAQLFDVGLVVLNPLEAEPGRTGTAVLLP